MIQRIQTVYLLLVTICTAVCLFLPVGRFLAGDVMNIDLYNLYLSLGDNLRDYSVWALFALLLLASIISFVTIFLYKRRMLQVRMTIFCALLLLGYCIAYAFFVYRFIDMSEGVEFKVSWAASLPIVSVILDYLAFRGIMKDEMLIRALDRLR